MVTRKPVAPPDGGWGWLVVLCSCGNYLLFPSCFYAYAVVLVELLEVTDSPTSTLALLGSLQAASSFMFNVISGVLINKFGCRFVGILGSVITSLGLASSSFATGTTTLFLTLGLMTGIGMSLGLSPAVVIVQQYFTTRRALASGMTVCGLSVGALITAPSMRLLIDTYTWRGAQLIHAGIVLHGCIFSCSFRPLPMVPVTEEDHHETVTQEDNSTSKTKKHKSSTKLCLQKVFVDLFDFSLWLDPYFAMYTIGSFCTNFGTLSFAQHAVNFAVHQNVDMNKASFIPTIIGAFSLLTRLLFSFISNMECTNRTLQYGCATIACGLLLVMSFTAKGIEGVSIIACAFGFFVGLIVTIQSTLLVDLIGVSRIAQAHGMFSFFTGISILSASPLAGYLLDTTGTYQLSFSILGCVQMLGGLIVSGIAVLQWRKQRRQQVDKSLGMKLEKTKEILWLGSGEILEANISSM